IDDAILERCFVTGDFAIVRELFDDLVADYRLWEQEKQLPDGMFWQFDVWDGMEESISGSRTGKNRRPTINSYMVGKAQALMFFAAMLGKKEVAAEFRNKAAALKKLVQEKLWDNDARFFKAQTQESALSGAREEIGFIPWYFQLPEPGYE